MGNTVFRKLFVTMLQIKQNWVLTLICFQDSSYLEGGPYSAEEALLLRGITVSFSTHFYSLSSLLEIASIYHYYLLILTVPGSGSKRGSLGGGSDTGNPDYPGDTGRHPPSTRGSRHSATTDQYYADQYDQYYRSVIWYIWNKQWKWI